MKTPILGSAYVARSVNAADNRMVNLFPEIIPEGGKEAAFLNRAPGLRLYRTVGNGPIRGMWSFGGDLYAVSGTGLYKVSANPLTAAKDGSWLNTPDDCGITSAANITGSGNITLEMTDAGEYQFTVGTEKWPETPSPWADIVAGSPHTFALATLTFADTPPVTPPPSTACDPNALPLTGISVLADPYPVSWPGTTMRSTALAGTDTKIVAIGSRRTVNDFDRTVAVYDIATDTWERKSDFPGTIFVEAPHAFTIDQDTILLYGFEWASYQNYLYKYTLSTDTWTQLTADASQPRSTAYVAWNDGRLYLLGGKDPTTNLISNTGGYSVTRIYDYLTDTWSNGPVVSDPCFGSAMVFHSGKMILVGGGNNSGWYDTVRSYDPVSGIIETLGSIPTGDADQDVGVASTGEGLYVACRSVGNRLYRVSFADWSAANVLVDDPRIGSEPSLVRAGSCSIYMTSSGGSVSNFTELLPIYLNVDSAGAGKIRLTWSNVQSNQYNASNGTNVLFYDYRGPINGNPMIWGHVPFSTNGTAILPETFPPGTYTFTVQAGYTDYQPYPYTTQQPTAVQVDAAPFTLLE